jgi:hypothetical protein
METQKRYWVIEIDDASTTTFRRYLPGNLSTKEIITISDGRWRDMYCPGVQPLTANGTPYQPPGVYSPGSKQFVLDLTGSPTSSFTVRAIGVTAKRRF